MQNLQEPDPQPKLGHHYKFIYGKRIISNNFVFRPLHELEIEKGITHRWIQIFKSKNVEDVGLMEKKVTKMCTELSYLRLRVLVMWEKFKTKNTRLREQPQEKETQIFTMDSLSMETL